VNVVTDVGLALVKRDTRARPVNQTIAATSVTGRKLPPESERRGAPVPPVVEERYPIRQTQRLTAFGQELDALLLVHPSSHAELLNRGSRRAK
jgi:hypothetical protein